MIWYIFFSTLLIAIIMCGIFVNSEKNKFKEGEFVYFNSKYKELRGVYKIKKVKHSGYIIYKEDEDFYKFAYENDLWGIISVDIKNKI